MFFFHKYWLSFHFKRLLILLEWRFTELVLCYCLGLQKKLVFSISNLWSLWWPPGHSEWFCMTIPGITDTQKHCQTRTSAGDTSICVRVTMHWDQRARGARRCYSTGGEYQNLDLVNFEGKISKFSGRSLHPQAPHVASLTDLGWKLQYSWKKNSHMLPASGRRFRTTSLRTLTIHDGRRKPEVNWWFQLDISSLWVQRLDQRGPRPTRSWPRSGKSGTPKSGKVSFWKLENRKFRFPQYWFWLCPRWLQWCISPRIFYRCW